MEDEQKFCVIENLLISNMLNKVYCVDITFDIWETMHDVSVTTYEVNKDE